MSTKLTLTEINKQLDKSKVDKEQLIKDKGLNKDKIVKK